MKTPKEKAEELVKKMRLGWLHTGSYFMGKQCALIAVDEILDQFIWKPSDGLSYWTEVKQEINNL